MPRRSSRAAEPLEPAAPLSTGRSAATMKDVAALAGVSLKTVSNVINDYPYIRPETKARVEQAITSLGYEVNASARSLRRGRTGVIGLAIPELGVPYFAELAGSVMRAAEERGLSVLIEMTSADRATELRTVAKQRRTTIDGLIFSPLAMGMEDRESLDVDYPLVLLGERIFGGPTDHVTMANVDGARAATRHLIERGARRIAVVGVHAGELVGSAALRLQGHLEALAEAGIDPDPALQLEAGLWHRSTGAAALARALDDGLELDAVFGLNDALALGALHILHERHVRVPQDVQVIGFDDIEETAYSVPTLTTVAPGRDSIASTAVDLLCERIDGVGPAEPRLVVTPFEIRARSSTLRAPA